MVHTASGVRELRLNRPERLNALTHALAQSLLAAVEEAMQETTVRVLLLCAEGSSFCAGKDRDEAPTAAFVLTLQELAARMVKGAKPVVAAVQGWAVGAGFELALGCDLVVASADARFALPESRLGLPATGGVHALLPRIVGTSRAKGLLWTGMELGAAQAHDWGLVWELVHDADPAALRARAQAIALGLAATDPGALRRVKRLVHDEQFATFDQALRREAEEDGKAS